MKHKKSIFDYYSIRVTPCAPEMTKIYYKGELCSANHELLSDIGYKALTKGLPDGFAILKNAVRRQQNKQPRFYMYFKLSDGDMVYATDYNGIVAFDINDIEEKLRIYKTMLRDFERMNYKIKTSSTATLGAGHVVENVKEEYATIDVSRVYFGIVDNT